MELTYSLSLTHSQFTEQVLNAEDRLGDEKFADISFRNSSLARVLMAAKVVSNLTVVGEPDALRLLSVLISILDDGVPVDNLISELKRYAPGSFQPYSREE